MATTILLTTGTSLATLSVIPYIKQIIQGRVKPRFVSWTIWTILLGLTTVVSWQEQQWASAVFTTASMAGCFVVALLTLRHSTFDFTRLERYTLLGAAIGVVMWLLFDNPMLVLLTAVTVDAIAYLPTFMNGWHNPRHESLTMFLVSAIGSTLVLLTAVLSGATAHGLIYPLYSVIFTGIMVGILLSRRRPTKTD